MKKGVFTLLCALMMVLSVSAQEEIGSLFPKWTYDIDLTATDYISTKINKFQSFKNKMAVGPDMTATRHWSKTGLGLNLNVQSPSAIFFKNHTEGVEPLNKYIIKGGAGIMYNFQNEYLIKASFPVAPFIFANALATAAQITRKDDAVRAGMEIPVGAGLYFKIADNVGMNIKGGYAFGVTHYAEDNIFWSLGATIGFPKGKKQTPPVVVDTDGDGIPDELDECPDVAGLTAFNGCPDTDGDGIPDKLDECPDVAGLTAFNGCPDTDGDGIPDKLDECPDVAGLAAFNGCPDTDGDGVPDKLDECPDIAGLVALKGCPDADGDGIPDHLDKCPTEAGPASNQGCPEIKEEVKVRLQEIAGSVKFAVGKSDIQKSSYKLLDEVVEVLNNYPSYKVSVEGHTDNTGSEALNQKLSTERAKVCADYLISKGISADRVTSVGFGPSKPIADNSTAEGKAKNRRTEFNLSLK